MSNSSEYNRIPCELTEGFCDNTCELWDNCPIEKLDVAQGIFVKEIIKTVIKYAKGKYKELLSAEGQKR